MSDSYWIIEWRYPASLGKPATEWQPVTSATPARYKEAAETYRQREYYDYRISKFARLREEEGKA